jgi:23S rRNA (pseudouridine1915-N3)-methyltransferase
VRILLIVVGRPRDAALAVAAQEYERRAARYWPLSVIEVREESARGRAAEDVREREGDRILAQLPAGAVLVSCTEGGRKLSSIQFSARLQELREAGRDTAFAIGGAFGLGKNVAAASTDTLSLGPWTLPHELARVVLAEQIYRAGTIARGEPYHK